MVSSHNPLTLDNLRRRAQVGRDENLLSLSSVADGCQSIDGVEWLTTSAVVDRTISIGSCLKTVSVGRGVFLFLFPIGFAIVKCSHLMQEVCH